MNLARLAMTRKERIAYWRTHRGEQPDVSPATARLLQDGKLEQVCPDCGRDEAAGTWCSRCYLPMGPDDWYKRTATPDQLRRLARARAARSGEPGAAETAGVAE